MVAQPAWRSAWAKSYPYDAPVTHWLPLHQHLDDTAAVAGLLVEHWISPQVLARIGADLPDGPAGVSVLARWLAGVHDVGKASPAFAVQVPLLADRMHAAGLVAASRLRDDRDRRVAPHTLVGQRAVRDHLVGLGFDRGTAAAQWAAIVGSHHGITPTDDTLRAARRPDYAGRGPWADARACLLRRATDAVGGLDRYRDVTLGLPSQVLLSAIVILPDWIASNQDLFPLRPVSTTVDSAEHDAACTARRAERAWRRLALPARWSAAPTTDDLDALFRARFGDETRRTPNAVQRAAVELTREQPAAGMIVIEAPMGSGKTEAAMLAAERLARRSGADGCFVALPTQATTDAMFRRVRAWLDRLPTPPGSPRVSIHLAHGKAALNDEFAGLAPYGRVVAVGTDEAGDGVATVHRWLHGKKKGVLASFVVGTIDQVLLAGLKSRHLMLRHLALAGKVVIVDEVHAYDVYMSQYLHRVLHWLGAYGVPVVLLSATLPPTRRGELLDAYRSGTRTVDPARTPATDYPVLTASDGPSRAVAATVQPTTVHLDHLTDDLDALVDHLRGQLADGGCAAVVRNTVARVQDTADRLVAEFGADAVTVTHSRFLACERARIDRDLVRRFGPDRRDTARQRHIVVGSQVIEQSLDVDFDLMVTDLAPVDLVLQRIGRLHRHPRVRPERLRRARCAVVGVPDWTASPPVACRPARRIYGDHALYRAAALLGPQERDTLTLPADIAPLVRLAYEDGPVGPENWQPAMETARVAAADRARRRTERAKDFLLGRTERPTLMDWLHAGVGDAERDDRPEGLAQVRDGEESLEVLVIQRDADGGLLTADWIGEYGGVPIPHDDDIPDDQARVIAACTLRLPLALCHPGIIDDTITALERNHYTSFDKSTRLKGQLVLVLDTGRTTTLHCGRSTFRLAYSPTRGLTHTQPAT